MNKQKRRAEQMAPRDETGQTQSNSYKQRVSEEGSDGLLEAKMAELVKTKEELKIAKDSAMQSWLDSRPMIDKLERLQSRLASAKNRSSMSNIVVAELESELETIIASIKSRKEEEQKAAQMVNETTQALDQAREEIEMTKQSADEERRARLKLKQVLRLKKQTLRTLQLTLRAVRMESEAYEASTAKALHHINCAETDDTSFEFTQQENAQNHDNNTVQLTHEDYHALQRKAKEETSLAKWRVSVSMEQKLAAEESRNSALARLKEVQTASRSRMRTKEETMDEGAHAQREAENEDSSIGVQEAQATQVNSKSTNFPKAKSIYIANKSDRGTPRQFRGSNRKNRRMVKKKKPYILRQLDCLLLSIKQLFR